MALTIITLLTFSVSYIIWNAALAFSSRPWICVILSQKCVKMFLYYAVCNHYYSSGDSYLSVKVRCSWMLVAVFGVTAPMYEQVFLCITNFSLSKLMMVQYLAGMFDIPGYGVSREPISWFIGVWTNRNARLYHGRIPSNIWARIPYLKACWSGNITENLKPRTWYVIN